MDNKIMPNEVFVVEHGALIRTRCPKDAITDLMLHERVVAANLAAGDNIRVQCMNHERDTVLSYREYLVYNRSERFERTQVNDVNERQGIRNTFSVIPLTEWIDTPAAKAEKPEKKKAAA